MALTAAFAVISCSKDDDDSNKENPTKEIGSATISFDNSTSSLSNFVWYFFPKTQTTVIGSESNSEVYIRINVLKTDVGTYTIGNCGRQSETQANLIYLTLGTTRYQSVSGTLTIKTSTDKIIEGSFTGQFLKVVNNVPTSTITSSCTFKAVYEKYVDND